MVILAARPRRMRSEAWCPVRHRKPLPRWRGQSAAAEKGQGRQTKTNSKAMGCGRRGGYSCFGSRHSLPVFLACEINHRRADEKRRGHAIGELERRSEQ